MKVMRVESNILTYLLLSDILAESTTYPVMTTSSLTPPLHAAQVPVSHTTNLYDDGYPSVALMIKTVDIPLPSSVVTLQNPMGFLQQPPSKCTLILHDALQYEEEEEDFQTVSLDDDHWTIEEIPDQHLCIHEHSVLHKLCPYPCPYMDYTSSSYYDTLNLSDISEFEDLMTTSSDEDISALEEDIGYLGLWTMVSK